MPCIKTLGTANPPSPHTHTPLFPILFSSLLAFDKKTKLDLFSFDVYFNQKLVISSCWWSLCYSNSVKFRLVCFHILFLILYVLSMLFSFFFPLLMFDAYKLKYISSVNLSGQSAFSISVSNMTSPMTTNVEFPASSSICSVAADQRRTQDILKYS